MPPLGFSDADLDVLARAAAPLQPRDRKPFLEDVARALQGHEVGPGLLHRIVVEVQRRYWDPPLEADNGDGERRRDRMGARSRYR
jgi:hypothetical protein